MNIAVVIPHRPVDEWRVENFSATKRRWESWGYRVFSSDSETELFSRAQAINRAAAKTDADVLIVADNDILLDTEKQAAQACAQAFVNDSYVVAFSELRVLDWEGTSAVHAGGDPSEQRVMESVGLIWGNCFAVSRVLFEKVKGFDERFVGYGHQDGAFLNSCSTLGSKQRVAGVAFHLRHCEPVKQHEAMEANFRLAARYRSVDGDGDAMLGLVAER